MEKSRSFPAKHYYYSTSSSSSSDDDNGFHHQSKSNSYSFNGDHQEMKRKKRIASYNMLTMESKLKSTARNSFKWIKTKFTLIRYGM